jgi:hypothetical protein
LERIIELLNGITEETSIEEARRVILDVVELCNSVADDMRGLKDIVDEQAQSLTDKDYEIARLKEENGRIYRDRAERLIQNTEDKIAELEEKTQAETESELIANIDI